MKDLEPLMFNIRNWGKKDTNEQYENVQTKTCEQCGRLFVPYRATIKQRFCHKECRLAYEKEHKDEINARLREVYAAKKKEEMQNKEPYAERRCEVCGKLFRPKHPLEKYCGDECRKEMSRRYNERYYANKFNENKEKDMYNKANNNNTQRSTYRPHYTTEDYNRKIRNKTRRIIDTLRQLDKAKLDEDLIFEAINNLNRMSLNDFDDAK